MKKKIYFLALPLLLISCGQDDLSSTRAYVEGKIKSPTITEEFRIVLESDGKTVAETTPNSSGNFVLSGPLFSEGFSVNFPQKIETFTSSKSGCSISEDSLSITIPKGISYITFTEISLKK